LHQQSRQASLAGVQPLIRQIFFDLRYAVYQVTYKTLCEGGLLFQKNHHHRPTDPGNDRSLYRRCCRLSDSVPLETALTKVVTGSKNGDRSFTTPMRYHGQLHIANLYTKQVLGGVSLRIDDLSA
jgi:hypothetical protein